MKTSLALLGAVTLLVGNAWAGPEVIIKQRAKELSEQNNARQGVTPAATPQPASTPGAAVPTISPSLLKLQTDLAAIKAGSAPTAEQKQKLAQDILGGAQGAKPSLAAATKLAEDLAAAAADKPLSASNRPLLARDLDALFNPGKYPQAKPDGIIANVQALFQVGYQVGDDPSQGGVSRKQAVAIVNDVKAIMSEIQKGGAQ